MGNCNSKEKYTETDCEESTSSSESPTRPLSPMSPIRPLDVRRRQEEIYNYEIREMFWDAYYEQEKDRPKCSCKQCRKQRRINHILLDIHVYFQ